VSHSWAGRQVVNPSHADGLEGAAALYEFQDGLPREEAEEKAYNEYTRTHHLNSAAHHLRGLRAAQASGDDEEARKHSILYNLHTEALGHDGFGQVPEEIEALAKDPDRKPYGKFRAHPGDRLLLPK